MNRLLLIPALVSCVAFVAWCLYWPDSPQPKSKEGIKVPLKSAAYVNAKSSSGVESSKADVDPEFEADAEEVNEMLLAKWDEALDQHIRSYRFSRKLIDRVPERASNVASTVFESDQQMMERLIVGSFVVSNREHSIRFPLIHNRVTGATSIYSNRSWLPFDDWVQTRDGIFR